ncbi:MAG: hypothetical protein KBB70_01465 [Candidatus Pacebacteria bacterium]|nr:hypothetical protein [Candidatus Paceibacterota bacterium]
MESTLELARYTYKKLGETPLECLNRFKAENPEYEPLTATYAGRLDPAAEGEMLLLFGDMVHEKDDYLKHDKTYTAVFALGVSTDTGDLLGLPTKLVQTVSELDEEKIKNISEKIKKLTTQTYPIYSSKPVDGKPLFVHAKEGNDVDRPNHPVTIYKCDFVEQTTISSIDLLVRVGTVCALVTGDFRQPEIIFAWNHAQKELPTEIKLLTFSLDVSSGTYIRGLCEDLEKELAVPTVLYSLAREKIAR